MKFLGIIIFSLLLSSQSFGDKKYEKDLIKISKDNGFVDNLGKIYSADAIFDKNDTILIVYTHGAGNDHRIDKCKKNGMKFHQ